MLYYVATSHTRRNNTMFTKLKKSFKRAYVKTIRMREERAAHEVARFLISNNGDFKGMNEFQLAKAIKSN